MYWLKWHCQVKDIAGALYKIKRKQKTKGTEATTVSSCRQTTVILCSISAIAKSLSNDNQKKFSLQLAMVHSWQTTVGCLMHVPKPLGRHDHRVLNVWWTSSMAVSVEHRRCWMHFRNVTTSGAHEAVVVLTAVLMSFLSYYYSFQIHSVSLTIPVSIHLLIHFSTHLCHHPHSRHPSLVHFLLQAQNPPFQQILSTVDFFYLLNCLTITGLDWTYHAHHFIFSFAF